MWFENDLPKVIEYYKGIFRDNLSVVYLGEVENGPGGAYQFATVELFGSRYDLLAAGPMFKFTEAISLTISCLDQEETDYYWNTSWMEPNSKFRVMMDLLSMMRLPCQPAARALSRLRRTTWAVMTSPWRIS